MDSFSNTTSLSNTLREARVAKGLELTDIAEITHVRKEYLQALEEGRYGDLPEDIYARNFLRLYAQAVGLDDAKLLERFSRERRAALGIHTVSDAVSNGYRDVTPKRRNPAAVWLPALLLVGALGGVVYFVFNTYFKNGLNPLQAGTATPSTNDIENNTVTGGTEAATESTLTEAATPETTPTTEVTDAATDTNTSTDTTTTNTTAPDATTEGPTPASPASTVPEGATTTPADIEGSVRFSLVTNPPGAEATLDNYPFPARTPFFNAPVTPREARVLRITLEGYQPYEEVVDIEADISKAITLVPVGATEAAVLGETPTAETTTPAQGQATGQGQLGITIEAETWLEIYQSTVRGEGERLVYTTVPAGQTYTFNLPVYVHVGNASGVRLSQDGQDIGLLGSSGEVTGRAFGQPLPPAPEPAPTPAEPTPTDPATEGPQ
jgi:cytoskeleton protein RodZ